MVKVAKGVQNQTHCKSMITSQLNGMTKWAGPGNSTFDAAAAALGEEVTETILKWGVLNYPQ